MTHSFTLLLRKMGWRDRETKIEGPVQRKEGNPSKQSTTVGAEALVWEIATSIDKEA